MAWKNRQIAGKFKSVVAACIKALCYEMRGAAKGMLKLYLMQYIKHIVLTRLGTDSGAADLGSILGGQNP